VRSLRLMTNNPAKQAALQEHGLHVLARLPVVVPPNINNYRYLRTKRDRMGHEIGGLDLDRTLRRAR